LSPVKKLLQIEIPAEVVTQEIDKAYKQLKKTAKIKGFRPGKTPRSVLERLYKKDVNADVSSRLIQNSFVDAIKETDLRILGEPDLELSELTDGNPYSYKATVEVPPEIDDIDYMGLSLQKKIYQPTEDEIETQLQLFRKNLAQYEAVLENRPASENDFAVIDYQGFHNGVPDDEGVGKAENFMMKLGKSQIHDTIDQAVIGMSVGDEKSVTVTFPEDHKDEKLQGRIIDFHIKLKEIREEKLPELDDEMAKKLGPFETMNDLKTKISENLEKGYTKRSEQELYEQIFTALIDRTDFEVPEILIEQELAGILQETERALYYNNTTMEEQGLDPEKLKLKYRDTAVNQAKRHLILSKIIEQDKLELSEEKLTEHFTEMAKASNKSVDEVRAYFSSNEAEFAPFKQALLEKEAMALIIKTNEVEEVEAGKAEVSTET